MSSLSPFALSALAFLAICGTVSLVALISPRHFARTATWSSRWVDSRRLLEVFDKKVDIDQKVLPYSRVLGALSLASVAFLTFLLLK